MSKYDGILFGNGLSINLMNQIRQLFPSNKQYLVNVDEFLRYFIENKLSRREEYRVFNIIYKSETIETLKGFDTLKEELSKYYRLYDSDIEYSLGVHLFREENRDFDYPLIRSFFPFLYNIWHQILLEYIEYQGCTSEIGGFINSMKAHLENSCSIFTTNFDVFAEDLVPDHLHGSFVYPFVKMENLILKQIDDNNFLYKCIWGWNGIGKLSTIEEYSQIPNIETFFDFKFFYSNDLRIHRLLIYGIGFRTSGYIQGLVPSNPKYKKPVIGGVIDEHILLRLKGLQTQGQLGDIVFACHTDCDMQHYMKLTALFNLQNVEYINSSTLKFDVGYI